MVSIGHRTGIGVLLMRRLQELFPIVAGTGANQLNKSIVIKMGHQFLDHIPRYIGIFDKAALADLLTSTQSDEITDYQVVSSNIPELNKDILQTVRSINGSLTKDDFSPEWQLYTAQQFGTCRDIDYLNYRYLQNPFLDYKMLIIGEARESAILVYRIEKTTGSYQGKVARILELIAPETPSAEQQMKALLVTAYKDFIKQQIIFADFYCSSSLYRPILEACGMELEEKPVIPNLLNPILASPRDQNLEIWTASTLANFSWNQLYVTKSDGDQDRPN